MKTPVLFFVMLIILVFSGCAGSDAVQKSAINNPATLFSVEQVRNDAEKMFTTVENVHPNIFFTTSREEYAAAKEHALNLLTLPMTRVEFYKQIAPVVAMIGDGHTNVWPPTDEFAAERTKGMRSFPFNVLYVQKKGIAIERNYSEDSSIVPGSLLLSVNGRNADSLFRSFTRYFSGEQERYREKVTATNFALFLWMHDVRPPFAVSLKSGDNVGEIIFEGVEISRKKLIDSLLLTSQDKASQYTFSVTGDSIGYIDFRSMMYLEQFRTFLKNTFTELQQKKTKGLIVDLRKNGGGNSQLGDELISYFSGTPYSMMNRKEWKMSAEYKQFLRERFIPWYLRWFPITWVNSDARKILGAEDGETIFYHGDTAAPGPNALRYSGKVVFLIGVNTFSSAMMTVDAVKEFSLATIIGEETGGIPSSYGETYGYSLPATRLWFNCSSALFVRANGRTDDRRGVLPDIEVKQSDEDTQKNIDTVLDFAKEWIKTH